MFWLFLNIVRELFLEVCHGFMFIRSYLAYSHMSMSYRIILAINQLNAQNLLL